MFQSVSVYVIDLLCLRRVCILFLVFIVFFFFFQAEDGIRDWSVTGVQTCALPISPPRVLNYAPHGWPVSYTSRHIHRRPRNTHLPSDQPNQSARISACAA